MADGWDAVAMMCVGWGAHIFNYSALNDGKKLHINAKQTNNSPFTHLPGHLYCFAMKPEDLTSVACSSPSSTWK